ncbi:MAG: lipid A biosynthesis lauroyl acyltransferase, partial [Gammaproteobacteria bacterium]|nr:lipid A biosynthesis lauroyl acyltransferase [Gammaproteobacteria bacterium]
VIDAFDDELGLDDTRDAELINKAIEDAIRVHPEQYLWVHRRFKTRPNSDDPDFYAKFQK